MTSENATFPGSAHRPWVRLHLPRPCAFHVAWLRTRPPVPGYSAPRDLRPSPCPIHAVAKSRCEYLDTSGDELRTETLSLCCHTESNELLSGPIIFANCLSFRFSHRTCSSCRHSSSVGAVVIPRICSPTRLMPVIKVLLVHFHIERKGNLNRRKPALIGGFVSLTSINKRCTSVVRLGLVSIVAAMLATILQSRVRSSRGMRIGTNTPSGFNYQLGRSSRAWPAGVGDVQFAELGDERINLW